MKKFGRIAKSRTFRIALYLRVSTEEQAENPEGSIKNQEQRLREYVRLKSMGESFGEVVEVFSDPGISAKDMNRPSLQKMLLAVQAGDVNLILVTELSRLSRSTKDFSMLQEFLEDHNCKFMSLRENFDTSGAAGSMVLNMMASIAEFERRQTGERVSSSFLARAKRGLYNGGSVPLGYRIDESQPGNLLVDEEMAKVVNEVFKTFVNVGTVAEAVKVLNARKLALPKKVTGGGAVRSSRFTVSTLCRILKNKMYVGVRVYQTKSGIEEVNAVWQPIVDPGLFKRANAKLVANRHIKRTHPKGRYPYTLSSLVFCHSCGGRLSGKSANGNSGKVCYYEHITIARRQSEQFEKLAKHDPHRIPAAKIEPLVWQEVRRFIDRSEFANELWLKAKTLHESIVRGDDLHQLEKRRSVVQGQIEILAERIGTLPREVDPTPLLTQLTKLQGSLADHTKEIDATLKAKPEPELLVKTDTLANFRKYLKSRLEEGETNAESRAALIRKVVYKIVAFPDGFEIHFNFGESHYLRELGETSGSRVFYNSKTIGREKANDLGSHKLTVGVPYEIRTRVYSVKGSCPRPLDERDS